MRKKIIDDDLLGRIEELLEWESRAMSIKEITKQLFEKYDIKRSPQVVLRHLKILKHKNRIGER